MRPRDRVRPRAVLPRVVSASARRTSSLIASCAAAALRAATASPVAGVISCRYRNPPSRAGEGGRGLALRRPSHTYAEREETLWAMYDDLEPSDLPGGAPLTE